MNRYEIRCTPEQTRKALELGAPIEFEMEWPFNSDTFERSPYPEIKMDKDGEPSLINPTAEQMLGFFRSKNIHIVIQKDIIDNWSAYGHEISPIEFTVFDRLTGYKSYEEATIAAIDAALEYLTDNK